MTRSAMTALAAALLLGAAGLLAACAGPKSTALVHAEKVEGLPICTTCHDADRARRQPRCALDEDARRGCAARPAHLRDVPPGLVLRRLPRQQGGDQAFRQALQPLRRGHAAPRRLAHPAPGGRPARPGLLLPLPRPQERGEVRHMSQVRRVPAFRRGRLRLARAGARAAARRKAEHRSTPTAGTLTTSSRQHGTYYQADEGSCQECHGVRPARRHLRGELLHLLLRRAGLPRRRPRGASGRLARDSHGDGHRRGRHVRRLPPVESRHAGVLQQHALPRREEQPPRRAGAPRTRARVRAMPTACAECHSDNGTPCLLHRLRLPRRQQRTPRGLVAGESARRDCRGGSGIGIRDGVLYGLSRLELRAAGPGRRALTCHGGSAPHPYSNWRGESGRHRNVNTGNTTTCAKCHSQLAGSTNCATTNGCHEDD